jgi:hypothetical protein
MSHYLDSPLSRQDSRLNLTGLYVFDGDGCTVFVLNSRTSLAGRSAPQGFHPEARYEVRIHLGSSPRESLVFRFGFDPEQDDGGQMFGVSRLTGWEATSDDATGAVLLTGRTGEESSAPNGVRVWTGRVLDPFFADTSQVEAIGDAMQHGRSASPPTRGRTNSFAGTTVNAIVLQVPHDDTVLRPGQLIRVWSSTRLPAGGDGWRQINRAGLPLIWPLFLGAYASSSSDANMRHPGADGPRQASMIARLVRAVATSARPNAYAGTVSALLTPDSLPYRIGTPAVFGFAGLNGRSLTDNAAEVMFSLVLNRAVPTGLTAARHSAGFPYVVPAFD